MSGSSWFRGSLWPPRLRGADSVVALDAAPVAVQYTPSSILQSPEGRPFWYCEGRKRYATCSGVAWYHENHLACVNVLGNTIHAYRFDPETGALTPIQELPSHAVMVKPENLAFSPDGSLVAITDLEAADVKIFRVDSKSHEISLEGFACLSESAHRKTHGIGFSPCGRFLAYTTVDKPGLIRLYRVEADRDRIRVEPMQAVMNALYPLVPKGIDFARDGSRVAICYGPNVRREQGRGGRGRLEIRAFDEHRGIASEPLSVSARRHAIRSPDDVRFFDGDAYVVLTQQGNDAALVIPVDPVTSELGGVVQTLRNPSSRLSFPHGAGVSADGRWIAITSYGDDKFGIYALRKPHAFAARGGC